MQKLELFEMEAIEGGKEESNACTWAGVAYVLGGAATVLTGGAAGVVLLGLGGLFAGTVGSSCF